MFNYLGYYLCFHLPTNTSVPVAKRVAHFPSRKVFLECLNRWNSYEKWKYVEASHSDKQLGNFTPEHTFYADVNKIYSIKKEDPNYNKLNEAARTGEG